MQLFNNSVTQNKIQVQVVVKIIITLVHYGGKIMTQTQTQTQTQIFDITERAKEWTIDEFLEIVDDAKCYSFNVWIENGRIYYREQQ